MRPAATSAGSAADNFLRSFGNVSFHKLVAERLEEDPNPLDSLEEGLLVMIAEPCVEGEGEGDEVKVKTNADDLLPIPPPPPIGCRTQLTPWSYEPPVVKEENSDDHDTDD